MIEKSKEKINILIEKFKSILREIYEKFKTIRSEENEERLTNTSQIKIILDSVHSEYQEEAQELIDQLISIEDEIDRLLAEGEKDLRLGSTPGKVVQIIENGELQTFYLKFKTEEKDKSVENQEQHLMAEYVANEIYRRMGILVPEIEIIRTTRGLLVLKSKFVHSENNKLTNESPDPQNQNLIEGFIIDVLLGNYDILLNPSNIISTENGMYRIDNGSSLTFKARGGKKKNKEGLYDSYTENPEEQIHMYQDRKHPSWVDRSGGKWRPTYEIHISETEIYRQVSKMKDLITDRFIDELLDQVEFTEVNRQEIRRLLIARRDYLIEKYIYNNPEIFKELRKKESKIDEILFTEDEKESEEIRNTRFYKDFSKLTPKEKEELFNQLTQNLKIILIKNKLISEEDEIPQHILKSFLKMASIYENYEKVENSLDELLNILSKIPQNSFNIFMLPIILNLSSREEINSLLSEEIEDGENAIKIFSLKCSFFAYMLRNNNLDENKEIIKNNRETVSDNLRKITTIVFQILKEKNMEDDEKTFQRFFDNLTKINGIESLLFLEENIDLENIIRNFFNIINIDDNDVTGILSSDNFIKKEKIMEEGYLASRLENLSTLIEKTAGDKSVRQFIFEVVMHSNIYFEFNPNDYPFLDTLVDDLENDFNHYNLSASVLEIIKNEDNFIELLQNIANKLINNSTLSDYYRFKRMENLDISFEKVMTLLKLDKKNPNFLERVKQKNLNNNILNLILNLSEEGVIIDEIYFILDFTDKKVLEKYKETSSVDLLINQIKNILEKEFDNLLSKKKKITGIFDQIYGYRDRLKKFNKDELKEYQDALEKILLEFLKNKIIKEFGGKDAYLEKFDARTFKENLTFYYKYKEYHFLFKDVEKIIEKENIQIEFSEAIELIIKLSDEFKNRLTEVFKNKKGQMEPQGLIISLNDNGILFEVIQKFKAMINNNEGKTDLNHLFIQLVKDFKEKGASEQQILNLYQSFSTLLLPNLEFKEFLKENPEFIPIIYNENFGSIEFFLDLIENFSYEEINLPQFKPFTKKIIDMILERPSYEMVLLLKRFVNPEKLNDEEKEIIKILFENTIESAVNSVNKTSYVIGKFAQATKHLSLLLTIFNELHMKENFPEEYILEKLQEIIKITTNLIMNANAWNAQLSSLEFKTVVSFFEIIGKEKNIKEFEIVKKYITSVTNLLYCDKETILKLLEFFEIDKNESMELKLNLIFSEFENSEIQYLKQEIINLAMESDNPERKLVEILNIITNKSIPLFARRFFIFRACYPNQKLENFLNEDLKKQKSMQSTEVFSASEKLRSDFNNPKIGLPGVRYTIFLDLVRTSIESGEISLLDFLKTLKIGSELINKINSEGIESITSDLLLVLNKSLYLITILIKESPYVKNERKRLVPDIDLEENSKEVILENLRAMNDLLAIGPNKNLINLVMRYYLKPLGYINIDEVLRRASSIKEEADKRNRNVSSEIKLEAGDLLKGVEIDNFHLILSQGFYGKEVLGQESDQTPLDHDAGEVRKNPGTYSFYQIIKSSSASNYSNTKNSIAVLIKPGNRYKRIIRNSETQDNKSYYTYDSESYEVIDRTVYPDHVGIRTSSPSTDISAIILTNVIKEEFIHETQSQELDYSISFLFFQIANNGFYIPVVDSYGEIIYTYDDYVKFQFKKEIVEKILNRENINLIELFDVLETNPFLKQILSLDAGVHEGVTIREHSEMVMDIYEKYFAQRKEFNFISRTEIRTLLMFHDIGKGWTKVVTGSTTEQHIYSNKILIEVLKSIGTDPRKISLFLDIIDQDLIGDCIKGLKTPEDVAKEIKKISIRHSLNPYEFLEFLIIFYSSDAGGYTSNAGSKGGNLDYIFNMEDMSLSNQNQETISRIKNNL